MKKQLMMLLVLSSFGGYILGSEQPMVVAEKKKYDQLNKPVEIIVSFDSDDRKLFYVGGKKMEYLKQKPAANSPCFINCKYTSKDLRTNLTYMLDSMIDRIAQSSGMHTQEDCNQYRLVAKSTRLQKITECFKELHIQNVIPLQYFLTDKEQFKKVGDVLFSFTEKVEDDEILFEVKLGEDINNVDVQGIIKQFCNEIRFIADDRNELEGNQIISFIQGYGRDSYKHGVLSYKAELDKKETEAQQSLNRKKQEEKNKLEEQNKKQKALLYSRLKKLFFGGSVTAIFIYLLYQKFYATAE